MGGLKALQRDLNQVLGEYYFQNESGFITPLDPDLYVHANALAGLEARKEEYTKSLSLFEEALLRSNVLRVKPSYAQLEELLRLHECEKKALL